MMIESSIGRPSWERSCKEWRRERQKCATSHTPRFLAERERSEKKMPPTHLNVVPLVVVAALPEQPVLHDAVDVELVENGVGVLAERSGEDNDFINLAHRSEEVCERYIRNQRDEGKGEEEGGRTVNSRSLDNVDVVELVLDLDGNNVVGLVYHLRAHRVLGSASIFWKKRR